MTPPKPFNDALKHQQQVGGGGGNKTNFRSLPLGIRIIGCFIRFVLITAVVLVLINWVLSYF